MAFIPIDAKADIVGSKKGKLTPAQHAQLSAWCLSKKTGILDCLGKCEAQNTKISATDYIAQIVFNSGYVVICGRLVECEAGTTFNLRTPNTGSEQGKIVLRYTLGNAGENEFVIAQTTSNLVQDDLNSDPINGTYEFELYSYNADSSRAELNRTISYIPSVSKAIEEIYEEIYRPQSWDFYGDGTNFLKIDTNTLQGINNISYYFGSETNNFIGRPFTEEVPFYGYRVVKGIYDGNSSKKLIMVELHEMLPQKGRVWINTYDGDLRDWTGWTNLGFKSGAITFCGVSYGSTDNIDTSSNGVFRQGNYVIGNINVAKNFNRTDYPDYIGVGRKPIIVLPEGFRPKKQISFIVGMNERNYVGAWFTITINTDGNAYASNLGSASGHQPIGYTQYFNINFGFEAPPSK